MTQRHSRRPPPTEAERIGHIINHAPEAIAIAGDATLPDLVSNRTQQFALNYLITVVGEAANKLTDATRASLPMVPWSEIIGMRNILIHQYYIVEPRVVHDTVVNSLPVLIAALSATTHSPPQPPRRPTIMSVAIGYVPGAFGQGGDDPTFLRELVELGDQYEYDSIWLSDRICSERFSLEPIVALSLVAGYSDRLKFGTSVLALPLRNPVVLAKQVATLDWLSQGRFFPAVGLGQEDPDEYEACGVPKADRARRTDEAIELMRRLWQEEYVTHEGDFFTTHNVTVTPRTFLKPSPPVWIGGRSPAAARRVGRVGDGWLVSSATPEEVRSGREIVFETAQQYDREIEEDHVGVLIGYYICDDQHAGEAKSEQFVTRQRPDAHFTEYSAVGTSEQIGDFIDQYVDAGGYKFVIRPLCSGTESMEQLVQAGEEILPRFHGPLSG